MDMVWFQHKCHNSTNPKLISSLASATSGSLLFKGVFGFLLFFCGVNFPFLRRRVLGVGGSAASGDPGSFWVGGMSCSSSSGTGTESSFAALAVLSCLLAAAGRFNVFSLDLPFFPLPFPRPLLGWSCSSFNSLSRSSASSSSPAPPISSRTDFRTSRCTLQAALRRDPAK